MSRTNYVVSCRSVSYVARSARFALCTTLVRMRPTAVVSLLSAKSCGFVERCAVVRDISGIWPKKPDLVVDRAHFVIQDLEEEGSDGLLKCCKVGFGRLSNDRLEVVKGVGKFRHDLLRRHSAPKMARLLSWGSYAVVFEGLRKRRLVTVVTTYVEEHHRCFGLGGYFISAVLAAARYSRIGFSLFLAVCAWCVRVPGGSAFHLEPVTICITEGTMLWPIEVLFYCITEDTTIGYIEGWFESTSFGIYGCATEGLKEKLLFGTNDINREGDKLWTTVGSTDRIGVP